MSYLNTWESSKRHDHHLVEQHNGSYTRDNRKEGNERVHLRVRADTS